MDLHALTKAEWLVLLVAFAPGCKADPAAAVTTACDHAYTNCPQDPPPSTEDVTTCAQGLDSACGTVLRLYTSCVTGDCTDAGHANLPAIVARCAGQLDAYRNCVANPGTLPFDAGTPPLDTGAPPADAGTPPPDTGSSPPDALASG